MKKTVEQQITERFIQAVMIYIGPGHRWHFKRNFCDDMDMVSQELYKMENGITPVQLRHLNKFSQLTGHDLNYILTGKGHKSNSKEILAHLQEVIRLVK